MAIKNGRVEGLITVPVGGWAGTVNDGGGADAFTITAGDYYMSTSGGTHSLIEEIEIQLEAASGVGFTVSIADGENGTGFVTIAINSGTFTATMPSDMRILLGYAGNLTPAAASFVGTRQARSIWLPDSPMVSPYGAFDAGTDVSANAQMVSPSGHVTGKRTTRMTWSWRRWDACTAARVREVSQVTANTSMQVFWRDHVEGTAAWVGQPFGPIRIYWDADSDADYVTYKVGGTFAKTFEPRQVQEGWTGLWVVEMDRLFVVP